MAKTKEKLIIVESPTKAKTITRFLGKGYKVESSYGHVRDLPKGKLGIDEDTLEPHYVIPRKNQKNVTALRKVAAKSEEVILATDEDREGEAIAWHLEKALKLEDKHVERIVFHEITKTAIEEALKNPREIDSNLVDAQQARRVLDRLVGYKLSPFLWKKVARGLSAGRVQSVALRLIVDREEEIRAFKPEEYWTVKALINNAKKETFEASLTKKDGKKLEKFDIKTEKEAKAITAELEKENYTISSIEKKEVRKSPLPPFTTSTLQQETSKRLRFSAKKTMMLAQRLYENGHITYMRTDSVNLSQSSLETAKKWINQNFGPDYSSSAPRVFKSKSRLAQEAHEAIRPTNPAATPEELSAEKDEQKLYDLIWRRFMASQLPVARFDATAVDIKAGSYELRANGNILRFDGFLKVWAVKFQEKTLPELNEGDSLQKEKIIPEQHFTEPPPRYSEASLIKILEEFGIGRPSTYAPIISIIQSRGYVEKNQNRKFEPTDIGEVVGKLLVEHFPGVMDVNFTATIEGELDAIAVGKHKWQKVIGDFYNPFKKHLENKYEEVSKEKIAEEKTDEKCEKCGKDMIIKLGRFGKFIACSGYPECKNTKPLLQEKNNIDMKCPTCKDGDVVIKKTKKKRIFYGCTRWPDCDFASWKNPKEKD